MGSLFKEILFQLQLIFNLRFPLMQQHKSVFSTY